MPISKTGLWTPGGDEPPVRRSFPIGQPPPVHRDDEVDRTISELRKTRRKAKNAARAVARKRRALERKKAKKK